MKSTRHRTARSIVGRLAVAAILGFSASHPMAMGTDTAAVTVDSGTVTIDDGIGLFGSHIEYTDEAGTTHSFVRQTAPQ